MVPTPPVGWRIHYFRYGDRNEPLVGDVIKVGTEQKEGKIGPILEVHYRSPGSPGTRVALSVRHIDDQSNAKNGGFLRQKYGCWDYIPGFLPPVLEQSKPDEGEKDDRHAKGIERAKVLIEEGLAAKDVHAKVKTFGVKREEVEELLPVSV